MPPSSSVTQRGLAVEEHEEEEEVLEEEKGEKQAGGRSLSDFSTARLNSPPVQSSGGQPKQQLGPGGAEHQWTKHRAPNRTEAAALTLNPRENLTTKQNFWCTSHSSVDSLRLGFFFF